MILLVINFKVHVIKTLLIVANFTAGSVNVSVSLSRLHIWLMPMQKRCAIILFLSKRSVVSKSHSTVPSFHYEQGDSGRGDFICKIHLETFKNFLNSQEVELGASNYFLLSNLS